jgi:hypothetical protein
MRSSNTLRHRLRHNDCWHFLTRTKTSKRLTNKTRRWGLLYERLKKRCGAKKAIVAVARRAWCVIVSLLHSGQAYRPMGEPAAG